MKDMKDSELCQLSIEHWKRMIECVKWLIENKLWEEEDYCDHELLKSTFGETWSGAYCSLCLTFENNCKICPLFKIGENCDDGGSAYYIAVTSESWMEWINDTEEYMLPALYKAKEYSLVKERKNALDKSK
jgi:hypothetical protein